MEFFDKLKKASKIFCEVMNGKEWVSRSPVADERLVEILHPDAPGGCTREEIYYNASDLGTCGSVPVRPSSMCWTCTKCKQPVSIDTHEETLGGSGTGNEVTDITCPCRQVSEFVAYHGANNTLIFLRDKGEIVQK